MTTFDLYSFEDGGFEPPDGVIVRNVRCGRALSPSRLPGLDWALNPYVGCSHGCIYCYAPDVMHRERSTWNSRLDARYDIPSALAREVDRRVGTIGIGTVTDPYQPIEAPYRLTRKCLSVLVRRDNRVSLHTKSDLVTRDIDLLSAMDSEVGITITTLDAEAASQIEPGAPTPMMRLEAMAALSDAGVRTYHLLGPMLPLDDDEGLGSLLTAVRDAGASEVMLDPFRDRPGVSEAFERLPMLEDPRQRTRFMFELTSASFTRERSRTVSRMCQQLGLHVTDAF